MTTKNKTENLFTVIDELDATAKTAALKAIAHSSMARGFFGIQQSIRYPKQVVESNEDGTVHERDDEEQTNDDYNDMLDAKKGQNIHSPFDEDRVSQEETTERYVNLYNEICDVLTTPEKHSKWDVPMTPETMLDFMGKNSESFPEENIAAVSAASGISKEDIRKFEEIRNLDRKKQLLADRDTILQEFTAPTSFRGLEALGKEMDEVTLHQLGIKAIIGINKALERKTTQLLRSRRLAGISDLTVYKEAETKLRTWADTVENEFVADFEEAMDVGRNITLVDDI